MFTFAASSVRKLAGNALRAVLECITSAMLLPFSMPTAVSAVSFPYTCIFWLTVSQAVPTAPASKSL